MEKIKDIVSLLRKSEDQDLIGKAQKPINTLSNLLGE